MIGFVLFVVILVLLIMVVNIYLSWVRRKCPDPLIMDCPKCPDCPSIPDYPDPNSSLVEENKNLKAMIRYLTLIIKKYEAEKELYKLSHGYHQVYNSPKMEYIKKELHRIQKRVKSQPTTLSFFEQHLNGII